MKWFWFALYYLAIIGLLCWVNHGVAEMNDEYEEKEKEARNEENGKGSKAYNALRKPRRKERVVRNNKDVKKHSRDKG